MNKCFICGKPFTDEEWDDRHSFGIEDAHADCCPNCKDDELCFTAILDLTLKTLDKIIITPI